MPMTTVVTLAYEGAYSCLDCQRIGIPVCAHIGFNADAWVGMAGTRVHVPGLDADERQFQHTLRGVEISADRKTVTLTIDTERARHLDLARHLSTRPGPKAMIRAHHATTGEQLAEGGFDAFLQHGEPVWVGGAAYTVVSVDHPHRDPDRGVADLDLDWQVVQLQPATELDPVSPAPTS
jgi:hypothetical protein